MNKLTDQYHVSGVALDEGDGLPDERPGYVECADDDPALAHFSLYVIDEEGHREWVSDHATRAEAERAACVVASPVRRRVMVDVETMGTGPRAALVAIGAVVFSADGVCEADGFYRRIDLASSMAAGLVVDADTVRWWMRQCDEARDEVARMPGDDLVMVLYEFCQWLAEHGGVEPEIWGNGAASDPVWVQSAFEACCCFKVPWRHWQVRCFRTFRELMGWPRPRNGHHALRDAIGQARMAAEMLKASQRSMELVRAMEAKAKEGRCGLQLIRDEMRFADPGCSRCGGAGTVEGCEGVEACECWRRPETAESALPAGFWDMNPEY